MRYTGRTITQGAAMSAQLDQETAVRYSRLSLWCAFALILLLAGAAVLPLAFPAMAEPVRDLMRLLPVAIVIVLALLSRSGRPAAVQAQVRLLQRDELHRHS